MSYLLDTNIVSLALKQNPQILQQIEAFESQEQNIFGSPIISVIIFAYN